MTDLDARPTQSHASSQALPRRPGPWRVISILAVVAAVVIAAVSVLQARDASNVPAPEQDPVELEDATVLVDDVDVDEIAAVAVLGLADNASRRPYDPTGTKIELPADMAATVGLYDSNGSMIGLAVVRSDEDRSNILISAQSTAEALIALSPGVLSPDLAETLTNVGAVAQDPAFVKLVEAIRLNPNLSSTNAEVETAYAELADRVPVRPLPRQGCDSVLDSSAYPTAGTCVEPEATGLQITNEQNRWALIYDGADGLQNLCATISPAQVVGSEVLIPIEQCDGQALMVAPGPIANQGDNQRLVEQRVLTAAGVNMLHGFAGPFADLTAGSAGFTIDSVQHIRRRSREVVGSLSLLVDTNEEFAAAMEVATRASTAGDRHLAAVAATRVLVEASDTTALIPHRTIGDTQHVDLLDFFTRSGERMVASSTGWQWQADAVGTVDFGGES